MQSVAAPRPFCGGHGNTVPSELQVCPSFRLQKAAVAKPTTSSFSSSLSSLVTTTLKERTTVGIFATYKAAQAHSDANNVKVKFVLHRACQFGQQFNVVGDDPLIGTWNPQAAVPMKWSEGHIWTTELDIQVGKRIEFKFILTGNGGHIEWQPGANNMFETSQKFPSLLVKRPWAEFEEDPTAEAPTISDHHIVEASTTASFEGSDETSAEIAAEITTADIGEGDQGASVRDFTEEKVLDVPLPNTHLSSTVAEQSLPSLLAARSWEEFEDVPTAEPRTGSKVHILEAAMNESPEELHETSAEISGDSGTDRNDTDVSTTKSSAGGRKTSLFEGFVRSLMGFLPSASIDQP